MNKKMQPMVFALLCLIIYPACAQESGGATEETKQNTEPPPTYTTPDPNGNSALVNIERFQIQGNTLLNPRQIETLLTPFKGNNRSYTDIQFALETLEGAYRNAGYSAVHVVTPEQEISNGTIIFQVVETVIGKVRLNGNKFYDTHNIRNALPALNEGSTPSARQLSQNIRLANENPTRQLDVVLALGEEDNTVDAEINVQDSSPHKVFITLDNTGSKSTGQYRSGIGYQHNNLFNRDQALTLNYITSPDHIKDVTQLSASYRLPLYRLGDSIDLVAAHSDTNAGTSMIVSGPLNYSGKGNIYGAHYNHYFPRQGDSTSKIIAGIDYRAYLNNCTLNGAPCQGVPDLTVHPISLSYGSTLTKPGYVADYNGTVAHNLAGGARGSAATFRQARPGVKAAYTIVRGNGSVMGALPQDWQYRAAGNLQYSADALLSYESIGLVGANAVRGFEEREISNDKGAVLNLELYSPELGPKLKLKNGSLRMLAFVDRAKGWKVRLSGEAPVQQTVGSLGVGLRSTLGKNLTGKFDWARVTQASGGNSGGTAKGGTRGQLSVMASW
jgi:hemolysin activation/secretion protein